jgi:hypothetical protein
MTDGAYKCWVNCPDTKNSLIEQRIWVFKDLKKWTQLMATITIFLYWFKYKVNPIFAGKIAFWFMEFLILGICPVIMLAKLLSKATSLICMKLAQWDRCTDKY